MYMATRFLPKCTCTKMYKNVVGPPPIIEYPINFANEINKLLDNFIILNPFRTIFSDYIPD